MSGETGGRARECVCAHERRAHEHYRPGSDCSVCDCPRFRAATGWRALLGRLSRG
ncbi:hypothetical protein [Kineococcus indalonis]|uniref:hypothetical protein n=1 Tax=Kineococcus indalonis TaxID=2696566 RepID=UPI0014130D7F|nr:hypothetical protein [Kineococcus indalonis]NAZ87899.1 hypothetical protein [Kineococcus indalonis]